MQTQAQSNLNRNKVCGDSDVHICFWDFNFKAKCSGCVIWRDKYRCILFSFVIDEPYVRNGKYSVSLFYGIFFVLISTYGYENVLPCLLSNLLGSIKNSRGRRVRWRRRQPQQNISPALCKNNQSRRENQPLLHLLLEEKCGRQHFFIMTRVSQAETDIIILNDCSYLFYEYSMNSYSGHILIPSFLGSQRCYITWKNWFSFVTACYDDLCQSSPK